MLLDLIDKIIDRCIQLVEKREKADLELYSDILAPALEDFEHLYKDYVKTFMEYRRYIESSYEPTNRHHPIFDQIYEDSVLSADMRSRIFALRSFAGDPVFGRFIRRMCIFITGGDARHFLVMSRPVITNIKRHWYQSGLKEIFEEPIPEIEKDIKALKLVDDILAELQHHYQLVMDEHVRLRARLLGLEPDPRDDHIVD